MFRGGPAHGADEGRAVGASAREFSLFLEQQVGSRAASEDILRDAFVRSRPGGPRASEPVCDWFYRSLRDAVLDQPRRAEPSEGKLAAFRSELAQRLEPGAAMREAIARHVAALSETLAPEQAVLLRWLDLERRQVVDCARSTGASPSSLELSLDLSRRELRRRVISSFGGCNEHGFLNCTCGASLGDYGRGRLGSSR